MKINFDQFYTCYAEWVIKWRKTIVYGFLALTLVIAAGARFMTIDGDMLLYFSKDMPQRLALDKIHDDYERTDNVVVAIAPTNKNVFTSQTLSILEKMTNELWKTPYASRVDGITNFQHTQVHNDDLTVKDLVEDAKTKTPDEIKTIRNIALTDHDLVNRLISPSGHTTGIYLTIKFPKKDFINEGPRVVKFLRDLKKKYESPDLKIYLTGTVFVDNAFAEAGQKDMTTLIPIMYGIMVLMLAFFFRSTVGIIASVFITLISVGVSLGIFGYLGIPMNPVTTAAPTMIITVVIADGIHFFITVAQLINEGLTKQEAIKRSIQMNFKPFLLTGVTNILGYLSLNFSDSPPFSELGNLVAIGMFTGWMLSIIWLPALIAMMPIKIKTFKMEREYNFEGFGKFVVKHFKAVIVVFIVATLGLAPFIYKNIINDMFLNFFDEDLEIRKDTEFVVDNLTGLYSIEYSLAANGADNISDPVYLKKMEEFERWFQKQDKVVHVSSFTSVMRRLNKIMHNNDDNFDKIPDDKALASQYLLMYEMSLPYGRDLNNQINIDKSATRFRVVFKNLYTADLKRIEGAANNWLKKNAPASMYSNGTSTSIMFRYLSEKNIDNMLYGYGSALAIIAIVMILAIKSIKFGFISLIPNILPTVFAFGLWGIFVGEVGLAVAFVTSFSSGIVVDDSVHFFVKYLRARRTLGYSPAQSIIYTFKTVGSSMLVSTLILAVGFSVLIFSPFQSNASMGILCSLTIFIALISDFFLTPALLMAFDKGSFKKAEHEEINNDVTYSSNLV